MTAINNKNVIKTFSHSTHKSHPNLSVRKKIKFDQNSILFRFFLDSFFMRINHRKIEKDEEKMLVEQIN